MRSPIAILRTMLDDTKTGLAAVTDALANIGNRVGSVTFTVGGVTATMTPNKTWGAEPAQAPAVTCATCGAKRASTG